jgi:hypothetical protein
LQLRFLRFVTPALSFSVQQREKILLVVLLSAVAILFVLPQAEALLLSPFQTKQAELSDLQEKVGRKEDEETAVFKARGQLQRWQSESLPPDPLDAQRVYQQWLVDLARLAGMQNIVPSLGSRTAGSRTFTSISVTLEGEATIEQLAKFLFHFERTRLLHRLTRFDVKSPETEGNPLLEVLLTSEAIALNEAPDRALLFPRTTLLKELPEGETAMVVSGTTGFPEHGEFRIRMGNEFLDVTAHDENRWTVARAVDGTSAAAHQANALVELAPQRSPRDPKAGKTIVDYRRLIERGPFTKPRPPVTYSPKLPSLSMQTLDRGATLNVDAQVAGWDPGEGTPVYSLTQAPEGMTISPEGKILWSPAEDVPVGKYPVTVVAKSDRVASRELTASFDVTLREVNRPPQVEVPAALPVAYVGREWKASLEASDPDQAGPLEFSLGDNPPEGISIDPATGVLSWTPPATIEPGDKSVAVKVQDRGDPPQSTLAAVPVRVEDDPAQFTFLVGCIRDGDRWTAWLYDRSSNTSRYLTVGTDFMIADIHGLVAAIDLDSMEFATAEGRWRLHQEQNLRQAELIPQETAAETSDSAQDQPRAAAQLPQPAAEDAATREE